jgi:hypothetical protein
VNPFRSAVILTYAVAGMVFAVGWQLLEDRLEDVRQLQRLKQETEGWWKT